jgi:uroporphyrinogen decarboxylase
MVNLWEDMCYKNGPIISPKLFDTFMRPYYKELLGFLKQDLGIPIIGVDTDGDMHLLIPKFVEAGANLMWPFEVLSGMDVLEVRRQWPREFAIWGGMDKRALVKDHAAISAEVMRVVPPMLSCGGYIPCIDHSVPPDVSFENWNYYLHLVRELGERTPVKGSA